MKSVAGELSRAVDWIEDPLNAIGSELTIFFFPLDDLTGRYVQEALPFELLPVFEAVYVYVWTCRRVERPVI